MDIHYNAFISYRHHPLDIKVAEQIHRGLEHYKVPKAIKKKQDAKLRLFRDKEELPITSNLTDDITKALENSDFLIVICSTHTKESIWVQREIETFLKTHDHSRVLTVLVDGQDPYEILPEILCSREEVDPQTGEKTLLPIEPLSCDWRAGRRKARREELPRLAAALLGCGYDELRQRERQYRTRRLVTVFSLAMAATLGLMSYILYNSLQIQQMNDQLTVANDRLTDANIRIQENLDEALINQSQYLASASTQQLEAGDRMVALSLALAALPEHGGERPYVAEAELALSEAVGAYRAEGDVTAVGAIVCDATVNRFEATDDRAWMFVTDSRHTLSVWDLQSFQKKTSIQLEAGELKIMVTPQDNLVLHDVNEMVSCYDKELNLLWQKEEYDDMVWSDDRQTLLVEKADNWVEFLDANTGQTVLEPLQISLQELEENRYHYFQFDRDAYDLSRPIVLEYSNYGDSNHLIGVDVHSGEITRLDGFTADFQLRYTGVTEEGNLLALFAGKNGSWNGMFNLMMTRSTVPVKVCCYTPAGEKLWQTEFSTCSYAEVHTLEAIDGTGRIFCQIDNVLAMIDGVSGELLGTCEIGANPIWVQPDDTDAAVIQEDGSIGIYTYEDNEYNSFRYFKENLGAGFGNKGIYVKQRYTSQILAYATQWDDHWQIIAGEYDVNTEARSVWNHLLATSYYDGICLFDMKQQKLLWTAAEDRENYEIFQLMGFSQDGSKLWVNCSGKKLIAFDTASGQREEWLLPEHAADGTPLVYSYINWALQEKDKAYYIAEDLWTDDVYAVVSDRAAGKTGATKVCSPVAESADAGESILLAGREYTAYLWEASTASVYKVDVMTDELTVLQENVSFRPVLQFLDDEGNYLLCTGGRVALRDSNDQEQLVIILEDTKGVSGYILEDQLLLLTDSGDVVRYDLKGNKLGDVGTHLYTDFFSRISDDYLQEEIKWTLTDDGDLVLEIFQSGNLIDTDSWQLKAWIPQCIAYYADGDLFVTLGQDEKNDTDVDCFGVYPRYSLEELKEMAVDALKGFALTQEQKEQYGIS